MSLRRCENCVHFAQPGALSVDHRGLCQYPMPQFLTEFADRIRRTLATDGVSCAVHQLEGEE